MTYLSLTLFKTSDGDSLSSSYEWFHKGLIMISILEDTESYVLLSSLKKSRASDDGNLSSNYELLYKGLFKIKV